MAIASVACPKCSQTFRSSDDVKDTRIRCPLCGFAFVVSGFVGDHEPPIARAKAKPADDDDEDDGPKNFEIKTVSLAARCPNCANQMESEDAIICLFCGYNTQTRTLGKTKKIVHQTGVDSFKWITPGILCAIAVVALMLFQHIYVLGLGPGIRSGDSWVRIFFNEAIYLWLTMILAGVMWRLGQFAFKRLLLEPTPPEEVID